MQAKECHDSDLMKPLDSDDRMELPFPTLLYFIHLLSALEVKREGRG